MELPSTLIPQLANPQLVTKKNINSSQYVHWAPTSSQLSFHNRIFEVEGRHFSSCSLAAVAIVTPPPPPPPPSPVSSYRFLCSKWNGTVEPPDCLLTKTAD